MKTVERHPDIDQLLNKDFERYAEGRMKNEDVIKYVVALRGALNISDLEIRLAMAEINMLREQLGLSEEESKKIVWGGSYEG